MTAKPKLHLHVSEAAHFLSWELPYFKRYFEVVEAPASDTVLFVFGPDMLSSGATLPALVRVAFLVPGFGYNSYFNLVHRLGMQRTIELYYDLVLANPGPIAEVFSGSPKLRLCPYSVNVDGIRPVRYRTRINSLLHASADLPQKDWARSQEVMRQTGLRYEVYPSRKRNLVPDLWYYGGIYMRRRGWLKGSPALNAGYRRHDELIAKYSAYDGFVHIAAQTPPFVDAKYTATLLEAGLTGSILFWHDTLSLGNEFETVFSLPLDPEQAAKEILIIRSSIDVETHSKRTAEEIREHVNIDNVLRVRYEAIRELL